MYTSSILLATFAATASASLQPLAIPHPRRAVIERALEARKTASVIGTESAFPTGLGTATTVDAECASAAATILALITDLPSAPAALTSWAVDATETDPCSVSVPASLSSDYSVYSSEVMSWYSEHSAEISSAVEQCTSLAGETTDISDVCTSASAAGTAASSGASSSRSTVTITAAATATATATGGAASATSADELATATTGVSGFTTAAASSSGGSKTTASSSSSTAVVTGGAVAREVGVVGAVFAGVLGAVIAL